MAGVNGEIEHLRDGQVRLEAALHNLALQQAVTSANVTTTSGNVDRLTLTLNRIEEQFSNRFASKSRFEIVEKVVFGAAGAVLLAVLTGLLTVLFKHPQLLAPGP